MRIRLRGPGGASTVTLGEYATVADLKKQITEKTTLNKFDIKYSYPPKPLHLAQDETLLAQLSVPLDGEQLTISAQNGGADTKSPTDVAASTYASQTAETSGPSKFVGRSDSYKDMAPVPAMESGGPIPLQRKEMAKDTPELAMPDRGATLVMRVMPDDNSCLFRAFGTAFLPGDDLSMLELRSLVASEIQAEPDVYTKVILDNRDPDDYCRWLQTDDAWGGAIELTILSKHFNIEICSIDVQSLRIDRFNEGAPIRCILVYSGIHYDTIVQSPSDPPHTTADAPPELDKRVWDSDDDEILIKAQELCKILQSQNYFTDTGGMAIKCNVCGWVGYGEGQAATHAQQSGHYDMAELQQQSKRS